MVITSDVTFIVLPIFHAKGINASLAVTVLPRLYGKAENKAHSLGVRKTIRVLSGRLSKLV